MSQASSRDSHRYFGSQVALGMAFGYLVLHPVSMIIFRWLGGSTEFNISGVQNSSVMSPIFHSFQFEMLPMGLVFGVVSGTIAAVYAWQRITIIQQRDDLSGQLVLVNQYRSSLEHKAEELEEKNRQLISLEKQNRRSTQFMVHDFKTHLGCILGYSDLLLERKSFGKHTDATLALRRIRRQAHQMMGAVSDLLDIARLEETGQAQTLGGLTVLPPFPRGVLVTGRFDDALGTHTDFWCKQLKTKASKVSLAPIMGESEGSPSWPLHQTFFGGILIGLPVMGGDE
jgi:signal transduction histidine kinase